MKAANNTLDWNKLETFVKERSPESVEAGLLQDWYMTAATVYENGEWKDRDRAYVSSFWATPGFKATMPNGDVIEVVASRPETPEEEAEKLWEHRKTMRSLRRAVKAFEKV